MASNFEFYSPTRVIFGKGTEQRVGALVREYGGTRVLIVYGGKSAVRSGVLDRAEKSLAEAGISSWTLGGVVPNPHLDKVYEGIRIGKENSIDFLLAVGGGSVIDTAKGARMVLSQNAEDLESLMGCEVLTAGRHIPFVAVPTTAGTGSECTPVAVISNPKKQVKQEYISAHLLPDAAILDVRMTLTLPPRVTASTGIDALCHAIEAYTCLQKNPMSDAYAAAAMEIIMETLPTAVSQPENKAARLSMANASLMAGTAFGNSMVGLVHAIGHSLGGICHVSHGDAMSILLPHVMDYNLDVCREVYEKLLLHLAGPETYVSTPENQRAEAAAALVRDFIGSFHDACGLPLTLRETGKVTEDQFEAIARTAISDGAIIVNPKAAGIPEIVEILKKAW